MFSWLINLINRHSRIYVLMPRPSYGNRAEEILFGLMHCQKNNQKLFILKQYTLFWPIKLKKSNDELLNIQSPHIIGSQKDAYHQLASLIITISCIPFRIIWKIYGRVNKALLGPPRSGHYSLNSRLSSLAYPNYGYIDLFNEDKSNHLIDINLASINKWVDLYDHDYKLKFDTPSDTILEGLGIKKYPWFVCLHVREEGFRKNINCTSSNRNASIKNYYKAINLIIKNGGCVVRIGDTTMTKLKPIDGLIDYANSKFNSELLDIYLVQHCKFYIGTSSGPLDLAALFQKDIICTNSPVYTCYPCFTKKSIFLHKNVYKDDELLSHKDIIKNIKKIEKPDQSGDSFEGYSLIENTEYELFNSVKYYLEHQYLNEYNLSDLEIDYINFYKRCIEDYVLNLNYSSSIKENTTQQKRLMIRILLAQGIVAHGIVFN